jgi:hypothetical protein
MDIEARFKEAFAKTKKEESVKNFLVKVAKVQEVPGSPDSFVALGYRVDNDQKVAIFSKKASSNQYLPEVGGVIRAEKATRMPAKGTTACFKSEYFYSYQQDSICLQAVIMAGQPRQDLESRMWQAQIHAYDIDVNHSMLVADQPSELEEALVNSLMPWTNKTPSKITHDVRGKALWADASAAQPGFSPFSMIRVQGQELVLYGKGSVKMDRNGEVSYRLPTVDEVRAHVQSHPKLQMLKTVFATLDPTELSKLYIAVIPGLSVTVGRDSIADRKYLAIPQAFDWKNYQKTDDKGNPEIKPGYRHADVHIKTSRTGRMMVVMVAPTDGHRTYAKLPETEHESHIRLMREARQANPEAAASHVTAPSSAPIASESASPQQAATPQVVERRTEALSNQPPVIQPAQTAVQVTTQPATQALPVFDGFDDEGPIQVTGEERAHADHDLHVYAEDLAAIELMNSSFSAEPQEDDSLTELLNDAAAQVAQRRASRPTMG